MSVEPPVMDPVAFNALPLIIAGLNLTIILIALFVGAIFLGAGIDAGDGEESSYGKRIVSIIFVGLVSIFPGIGILIGILILKSRHKMTFGKATLSYIVWMFLTGLVISIIIGLAYLILSILFAELLAASLADYYAIIMGLVA